MTRIATLLCATILCLPAVGFAAPPGPVRCAGRIQFRPCPVQSPTALPVLRDVAPPRPVLQQSLAPATPTNLFARVAKTSFQRVGARDGMWRGIVSGNGLVHLKLLIRHQGAAEQHWDIGSIHLKNGKSTHFGFRTVAPAGERWTWEVVARATNAKRV